MQKGDIIYCPKYKFDDGSESDKLLINLNTPALGEPYLILLVTSKQKFRKNRSGCHSAEGYYVIPQRTDFFNTDTWVLFETLREIDLKEELRENWNRNFITQATLQENTIRAIVNCLKDSSMVTKYQVSLLRQELQQPLKKSA